MTSSTATARVRYADIAGDHVYYANYLVYLEDAMAQFYRDNGLKLLGFEEEGVRTMIAECYAKYHAPARYDDLLTVTSTLAQAAPKRFRFVHRIERSGTPLLTGVTTHVLWKPDGSSLQPLPEEVMRLADERVDRVYALDDQADAPVPAPEGVVRAATRFPVRYKDADPVGAVYFANYLVYFEIGRTELFRSAGLSFTDMKSGGLRLPVSRAYCAYLAPARYADELEVTTWVSSVSKVKLTFTYEIVRCTDNTAIARGFTAHGCLGADGRPIRVPEAVAGLAHRA